MKTRMLGGLVLLFVGIVIVVSCGKEERVLNHLDGDLVGPGIVSRMESGNEVLYEVYLRPEGTPEATEYSFREVVQMAEAGIVHDEDLFELIWHRLSPTRATALSYGRGMVSTKDESLPPPPHNPCCDPPSTWGSIKCCFMYEQG